MPAQQTSATGHLSQPAVACKPTSVPSAAALGAGDSSGSMIPPENLLVQSHHSVPDPRHQGNNNTTATTTDTTTTTTFLFKWPTLLQLIQVSPGPQDISLIGFYTLYIQQMTSMHY